MKSGKNAILQTLVLILLVLQGQVSVSEVVVRNVRIISGENPQPTVPQDVFIKNGRITKIVAVAPSSSHDNPGAEILEVQGENRYLIPGLIDSHVHLEGVPGIRGDADKAMLEQAKIQIPRSYLYFGFTSVLDLASSASLIDAWNQQPQSPNAFYCVPVTIPNGYPLAWMDEHEQFQSPIARYMLFDDQQVANYPKDFIPQEHTPEAVVNKVLKDGGSCIKLYYETGFGRLKNLPVPGVGLARKLVAQAKKHQLTVFLHGNSQSAYEFAVATNVDVVVHGMWHWNTLDIKKDTEVQSFARTLADASIAIQPTVQVLYGERELFNPEFFQNKNFQAAVPAALRSWYQSEAGQWMKSEIAQSFPPEPDKLALYHLVSKFYNKPITQALTMSRAIAQQGGLVLFGSDTPSGPIYTQFPGYNGRKEMDRWMEMGFDLNELFVAMTFRNAKLLGKESSLGEIKPGYQADLLLLERNPLATIEAYDTIEKVIKNGIVLERKDLIAH